MRRMKLGIFLICMSLLLVAGVQVYDVYAAIEEPEQLVEDNNDLLTTVSSGIVWDEDEEIFIDYSGNWDDFDDRDLLDVWWKAGERNVDYGYIAPREEIYMPEMDFETGTENIFSPHYYRIYDRNNFNQPIVSFVGEPSHLTRWGLNGGMRVGFMLDKDILKALPDLNRGYILVDSYRYKSEYDETWNWQYRIDCGRIDVGEYIDEEEEYVESNTVSHKLKTLCTRLKWPEKQVVKYDDEIPVLHDLVSVSEDKILSGNDGQTRILYFDRFKKQDIYIDSNQISNLIIAEKSLFWECVPEDDQDVITVHLTGGGDITIDMTRVTDVGENFQFECDDVLNNVEIKLNDLNWHTFKQSKNEILFKLRAKNISVTAMGDLVSCGSKQPFIDIKEESKNGSYDTHVSLKYDGDVSDMRHFFRGGITVDAQINGTVYIDQIDQTFMDIKTIAVNGNPRTPSVNVHGSGSLNISPMFKNSAIFYYLTTENGSPLTISPDVKIGVTNNYTYDYNGTTQYSFHVAKKNARFIDGKVKSEGGIVYGGFNYKGQYITAKPTLYNLGSKSLYGKDEGYDYFDAATGVVITPDGKERSVFDFAGEERTDKEEEDDRRVDPEREKAAKRAVSLGLGGVSDNVILISDESSGKNRFFVSVSEDSILTVTKGTRFKISNEGATGFLSSNKKYLSVNKKGKVRAKKTTGKDYVVISYKLGEKAINLSVRILDPKEVRSDSTDLKGKALKWNAKTGMRCRLWLKGFPYNAKLIDVKQKGKVVRKQSDEQEYMYVGNDGELYLGFETVNKGSSVFAFDMYGKRYKLKVKVK